MIDHLDALLHRLFRNSIAELTADAQVRFQPPDEDWRSLVPRITDAPAIPATRSTSTWSTCARTASCAPTSASAWCRARDVFEMPPPRRVDCHYLISAWSPADRDARDRADPRRARAARRGGARAGRARSARPGRDLRAVQPAAAAAAGDCRERFPLTLLPVEGFPKYAEFWGTMGDKHRWKPCIYIVVTVPLSDAAAARRPDGHDHVHAQRCRATCPRRRNTRLHIGGTVLDTALPPKPVALAPGSSCSTHGERARAAHPRRRARALRRSPTSRAGAWRLRASAAPLGVSPPRAITVPEPTGEYDMRRS